MKILVTGATGLLGYDIMRELKIRKFNPVGIGSKDCNITNLSEVDSTVRRVNPDIIIHCAAYTDADEAENQINLCNMTNIQGTYNLVQVSKKLDVKFVYISTDYVFNGEGSVPWQVEDIRDPLNQYGISKYLGELIVENNIDKYFIIRVSWLFGMHGDNFIKSVLKLLETRDKLYVVNDQVGSPTYFTDASRTIIDIIQTNKYGKYHVTNEGFCSWYDFACEIVKHIDNKKNRIYPISSKEFNVRAKRPKNSRLDKSKLEECGLKKLPLWQDALERFFYECYKH